MFTSYLRKLRRMRAEELLFRTKAVLGRWYEQGYHALGFREDRYARFLLADQKECVFDNPCIDSEEQKSLVNLLRSTHRMYVEEIREAANAACEGQFTILGRSVRYGRQISWCADPFTCKEWPMRFHTTINIFSGHTEIGDVKYVWEVNRHQFLTTLGKAYCLTDDERYALAGLDLMEDWIRTNPYKMGINWTSALEVAVRSISWCWACAFFGRSKAFDSNRRRMIVQSLFQHAKYIEEHPSFYFSPYNHLIGEATALFVIGSLLPWVGPARRWQDKGWSILEREMPRQFYPDGGTVEQAIGYHHFTLGFYLQAVLVRRRFGMPVSSAVWSLLEKAFEFSMYMMRPDGSVPMIGDGDEGKSIPLSQSSLWDFRSFLSIGAVLFGREDFKKMAGPFPPDATWLVGRDGWNRYQAFNEKDPAEKSKALSETGYYIMRTGWDRQAHYLSFDCGEIAAGVPKDDLPSAAHGHADALSIEVSSHGTPLLVDPGFYTYNGEPHWHRYFRETVAHNTLVVDNLSQAEYRGRLKWSHAPQTELHYWVSTKSFDYVEGSHNGYERLPQPVIHRRTVAFMKPDYWIIRDELVGEGEHTLDRYFHFAPLEAVCDLDTKSVQMRSLMKANLAILAVEKEGVTVEILQDGEAPENGWLATGYGKKVRAPVARYRTRRELPVALHTVLIPFREEPPIIGVETLKVGSDVNSRLTQILQIKTEERQDVLLFSSANGLAQPYDRWLTDGRVACMRFTGGGDLSACVLIEGSILGVDGKIVLRLDKQVPFAAFSLEQGQPLIELSEPAEILISFPNPRIVICRNYQGTRNS